MDRAENLYNGKHLIILFLLFSFNVWADEGEVYVVEEERTSLKLAPGAVVTIINIDDQDAVLTLGDILRASPGIVIRETGTSQQANIRGAQGAQIKILIDGIPLIQDSSGVVDLSKIQLEQFERVEVYRGDLPLELAGEGFGGAINLISKKASSNSMSLRGSIGSFGFFEGDIFGSLTGPVKGSFSVNAQTVENDFLFYDDNGTPYTLSDDENVKRQNADHKQIGVNLEGSYKAFEAQLAGSIFETGVPGPGAWQALEARSGSEEVTGSTHLTGSTGILKGKAQVSGAIEHEHYLDELAQAGLGAQNRDSFSKKIDILFVGSVEPRIWADLSLNTNFDIETYKSLDFDIENLEAKRTRLSLGQSTALSFDFAKFMIKASEGFVFEDNTIKLFIDPGLSVSVPIGAKMAFRGSLSNGHRLPTFAELYGLTGTMIGNPELMPEKAVSGDLGFDWIEDRLHFSINGYTRKVTDLIVFVQNSQYTIRAENIKNVQVKGAELDLGLTLPTWTNWDLAVSFVDSRDLATNLKTPGQPVFLVVMGSKASFKNNELGLSLRYDSGSYMDNANMFSTPKRFFVDTALKLNYRDLAFSFDVKNILNKRIEIFEDIQTVSGEYARVAVSDYWGYPLPGRAFYFSLKWVKTGNPKNEYAIVIPIKSQ